MQAENLVNDEFLPINAQNSNNDNIEASSVQEDFTPILEDVKRLENFDIEFSDHIIRIDERTIVDKLNNIFIVSVKNMQREIMGYIIADLLDLETLKNKHFHMKKNKSRSVGSTSFKGSVALFLLDIEDRKGKEAIYKNNNRMDFRRENIKAGTISDARRCKVRKPKNEYLGVSKHQKGHRAYIRKDKKFMFLGAYKDPREAARVHDMFSLHFFGKDVPNNGVLTEEEVADILRNGIPEKYQRKPPRKLPKYIMPSRGEKEGYFYNFRFKGRSYQKTFETVEEALEGKEERLDEILEKNPEYEQELAKFRHPDDDDGDDSSDGDDSDDEDDSENDQNGDDEDEDEEKDDESEQKQEVKPKPRTNKPVKKSRIREIPEVITEEFVQGIRYVQEFEAMIRQKKWQGAPGKPGHFALHKMSQKNLKENVAKAIELLRKEKAGEKLVVLKKEKKPKAVEPTLDEVLKKNSGATVILTPKGFTVDLINKYITVPIQNNKHAIVGYFKADLDDYDKLSTNTYHVRIDRHGKKTVMCGALLSPVEHVIMGKPPEGFCTFYDNLDSLDLRRDNIKYLNVSAVIHYKPKVEGKYESDYKGVCKTRNGRYYASINYNKKQLYLGTRSTELDAAKLFDIYSVFYYGGYYVPNNTLTEDDVNNILGYGLPEDLIRREEISDDIYINESGQYYYEVFLYRKPYSETFDDLEEAKVARINKIREVTDRHIQEMEEEEEDIEIERNEDGQAIITLYDGEGNYLTETIVSEETWMETTRYSWFLRDDGYVAGYVNGETVLMHRYLHERYKGKIPKGITVDHIDKIPLHNLLDNIRTATRSLQNHNRNKHKGSIIQTVRGVTINGNKFVVNNPNDGRFSFDYLEDASEKFNELSRKRYGAEAFLNPPMPEGKTKVIDIIEEGDITEEYIQSIKHVELFKLIVKKKNWGGTKGKIKQSNVRAHNLEANKLIAIQLLREENERE